MVGQTTLFVYCVAGTTGLVDGLILFAKSFAEESLGLNFEDGRHATLGDVASMIHFPISL